MLRGKIEQLLLKRGQVVLLLDDLLQLTLDLYCVELLPAHFCELLQQLPLFSFLLQFATNFVAGAIIDLSLDVQPVGARALPFLPQARSTSRAARDWIRARSLRSISWLRASSLDSSLPSLISLTFRDFSYSKSCSLRSSSNSRFCCSSFLSI